MTTAPTWIRQSAAIPVQFGKVCLITSRSGKRMVIPKGIIEPGKTAAEIALQEAWEEAGLVGMISPQPVGTYLYQKYGGVCHVLVFLMDVTDAAEDWPEHAARQRSWTTPAEAVAQLDDPGLREIFRRQLHIQD